MVGHYSLLFEQSLPCLLEASNKTTGAILAQMVNLRYSKKAHNLLPRG